MGAQNMLPPPRGAVLVGQPFRLIALIVPVTATVLCMCGGENTTVNIVASTPAPCPSCGQVFNALFDPQSGKFGIAMVREDEEKPPS